MVEHFFSLLGYITKIMMITKKIKTLLYFSSLLNQTSFRECSLVLTHQQYPNHRFLSQSSCRQRQYSFLTTYEINKNKNRGGIGGEISKIYDKE